MHGTAQLTCVPWQEAFSGDTVRDLMDALLQVRLNAENSSPPEPGLELTDDHLLMTVGDIFGAGVETTTTVLKWAVLYLLHYPEVRPVGSLLHQGHLRRPWERATLGELSGF